MSIQNSFQQILSSSEFTDWGIWHMTGKVSGSVDHLRQRNKDIKICLTMKIVKLNILVPLRIEIVTDWSCINLRGFVNQHWS